jgi:starch synthase
MASAEAAPLAQVGGLGDVLRALPSALRRYGLVVRRFLPAYGCVDRTGFEYEDAGLSVPLGRSRVPVRFLSRTEPDGVHTSLVECEQMFGREGIYGPRGGLYADNARRFTLFSRAVCERARRADSPPDILHTHDWHTALLPLFVRFTGPWRRRPRTILTIHNLGYQGRFDASVLDLLSLEPPLRAHLFRPEGIEYYGDVNFLKAGLLYADRITAVSPTYAREIQTPAHGFGLDGVVRQRARDLVGILNGADYEIWNPASDAHLPHRYSSARIKGKADAGRVLRQRMRLRTVDRPLLGVVSRLVHQKGIDVLTEAAPSLLGTGADLAVLGSGDPDLVRALVKLRRRYFNRVGLHVGYHEALSHLVLAGSDVLLIPSRYEPCGLVQMHALKYGTIPIVHRTGGLADTVREQRELPGRGTGFVFDDLTSHSLMRTVRRALSLWVGNPAGWRALQRRAMAEDFSWTRAATRYADLYRERLH